MPRRFSRGFTVMELMITVVIVSVLLSIAVPSYQTMIANNCLVTFNNSLVSGLQMARSEAAKRRNSVIITVLSSGGASNEWGNGFRVWFDDNGNGTYNAGTDTNIREIELACGSATIDETAGRTEFTYDSDGGVDNSGTFNICDGRTGESGSQVSISTIGRPSSSTLTCS